RSVFTDTQPATALAGSATVPPFDGSLGPMPPALRLPRRATGATGSLRFVYFLWLMLLFQPHWWVVSLGAAWARHIPTLLMALLVFLLLVRLKVREWYLPLLMLVLFAFLTTPFAVNPAYAKEPAKALLLYWLIAIGTLSFVRTAREAIPILLSLGIFQFAWWGVLGTKSGLVAWHPVLGNYDDFGAAMVIGIG